MLAAKSLGWKLLYWGLVPELRTFTQRRARLRLWCSETGSPCCCATWWVPIRLGEPPLRCQVAWLGIKAEKWRDLGGRGLAWGGWGRLSGSMQRGCGGHLALAHTATHTHTHDFPLSSPDAATQGYGVTASCLQHVGRVPACTYISHNHGDHAGAGVDMTPCRRPPGTAQGPEVPLLQPLPFPPILVWDMDTAVPVPTNPQASCLWSWLWRARRRRRRGGRCWRCWRTRT